MSTAVISLTSDLKRKKWMREGLLQAASKSFWAPYSGNSRNSVVFQTNKEGAAEGHTVVFDFDGNLSGKAIRGKDTAYGKGEAKKRFSSKITVERYRLVADNGDVFDGVDSGNLAITQHSDSRAKLGDLFVRFKDQAIFDAAQGLLNTNDSGVQAPTHVIDLGTTFNYSSLLSIESVLKSSTGFTTGTVRRPLEPYILADGRPVWLFIIDAAMARLLKSDTSGYQSIMANADIRGANNRVISGVVGKIGNLLIVEASNFFGSTAGTTPGFGLNDSEIEIAGLRQYSGATPTTSAWTGQTGFDYASATLHSRGLLMGAGAIQLAMGKMPDYKWQPSQDFAIKSESAVEFWMEVAKTKLTAENTNYKAAKVTNIDYGCIAVDVEVQ